MKDYYKEMEEILNPMAKINREMEEVLNPMRSIVNISNIDYSKATSLSNLGLYISPFEEFQKHMEYSLNPLKKMQDDMEKAINPFKKYHDDMELIFNPFKDLEKNLNPIKSLMDSINVSIASTNIIELNKLLKTLDASSFKIEKTVEKEIEEQIQSLQDEDKKSLDEIFIALKNMFPEIEFISEAFSKKQYVRLLTYFFIFIYPYIIQYQEYTQKVIADSYYKINKNKVRVRTEPSTENSSTIIIKLNKNVFVEKIDSHKNWLKIEFENENGEEIEGWVRRDMLTKIEND